MGIERIAARRALLAVIVLTPAPAAAQRTGDSAQTVGTVTIATARAPTVIGGASGVTARVDSLHTPPAPTLDVALRRLPFVLVRTNARGEAELSVRGSESRTPTILLDGLPLSIGWDSRSDPSLIPLSGVSAIRVSRSAGSLLAGPNAVGSVLELDFTRAAVAKRELRVATGADHLGATVFAAAIDAPVHRQSGTLAFRAGASSRNRPALARADDVADPGAPDGERINSDARVTDVFASARLGGVAGSYLSAGAAYYDAERGVQPELHLDEPRLWRYPSQSRLFATLAAGTGVRASPWGSASLDGSVGLNTGKTEISAFTDRTYATIDSREFGDERTIVARAVGTHSLPGSATLRIGGTLASVRYLETLDTDPSSKYVQRLWSIGAEADVPLGARLTASAGVAFDGSRNPETGGRSQDDDSRDDLAARIGLSATFGPTRFHTAVSRRSRFPALRELYSGSLGRFTPNPELRPEQLTMAEGGVTVTRGGLQLQGVLFRQVNSDGVVRVTLPSRQFQRQNRDEIRSTGIETVATWQHNRVTVLGDLLVQRVRVRDVDAPDNERRPENVPETRFTLGVSAPAFASINVDAWLSHTGDQYCEAGEARMKSGTRLDLGADRGFRLVHGWLRELRVSLGIDNVANGAVYDQCGLPQPGRTLRATASWRLTAGG